MAWFRVDDQLPKNRKARALLKAADGKRRDASPFGLWALAGAWSNDGFVPCDILDDWDDDWESAAQRLVDVGLWHHFIKDGEPGYVFHDWEDQNPTTVHDSSGAGTFGNHIKWHVNRGQVSEDCMHCAPSSIGGDLGANRGEIGGDLAANRGESDRVSLPPVPPDPTRPTCASADAEHESIDEGFATWYAAYPLKKGKGQAIKAYRAARKKTDAETLLASMREQIPELTAKGLAYCPHPATWLNGERWADEVAPVESPSAEDAYLTADQIEHAPSGMTDEEYDAWEAEMNQRRAQ